MEEEEFFAELQEVFLTEMSENLEDIETQFINFENDPTNKEIISEIFRLAHTIKGSAKGVGFDQLSDFTHVLEDLLVKVSNDEIIVSEDIIDILLASNDRLKDFVNALNKDKKSIVPVEDIVSKINNIISVQMSTPEKNQSVSNNVQSDWGIFDEEDNDTTVVSKIEAQPLEPKTEEVNSSKNKLETLNPPIEEGNSKKKSKGYIRIPLEKLDNILDYFGEQVILQATLEEAKKSGYKDKASTNKTVSQLSKITYDLHQATLSLRMVPIKGLFNKMQRTVRDAAKSLNKKVEFITQGDDTELDKVFVDELTGVISHVLRNSLDHGIEGSDEREKKGKEKIAKVNINAFQDRGFFFLEIEDDGRGINREKVLEKAISKGIAKSSKEYSDEEIYKFIFRNGFSTAETVTDVSGRGVGMDAVLSTVKSLRGEIDIHSQKDIGTKLTIKLPLSMSIFNGIVFELCGDRFILPSTDIVEVYRFDDEKVTRINAKHSMVNRGDNVIDLYQLDHHIGIKSNKTRNPKRQVALICNSNGKQIAMQVDAIIGQRQIVQKKLGSELEDLPGVSGGAILGDGEVALVINISNVIDSLQPTG